MATIIKKSKGGKSYYYLVESGRVDGKPRIVRQVYLGTAEKIAGLVKANAAPVPLEATAMDLGLVGALWIAAQRSGIRDVLDSIWPKPRSGPSTAQYLLLAAIHRICAPGPKTEVASWYESTVLPGLLGIPSRRLSSQAFWDRFSTIKLGPLDEVGDEPNLADDLELAQTLLLAMWKRTNLVSERLLSYDTTNFYTHIATTNDRNTLAQRGHNKQGRDNLRQVGLAYVLDGVHGVSLCHHVYPGNVTDSVELPTALPFLLRHLDLNSIARETVTLVFDKGPASLANSLDLDRAGLGWVSALPWNQAPIEFRETPLGDLESLGTSHPGVQAIARVLDVHGKPRLCVLRYSAAFMSEQMHSLATSIARVAQSLRRLAADLIKPGCRLTQTQVQKKIDAWLAPQFLNKVLLTDISIDDGRPHLQFHVDTAAFHALMNTRLGRTLLITNRQDWTAEQVVSAYGRQEQVERVFRGLKDGGWLAWGPMYHWTDDKIRIHAFYCMLGVSLLHYMHSEARRACPGITLEQMLDELTRIQRIHVLYPPQGSKGPKRTATIETRKTLTQQLLSKALGLDTLNTTPHR